MKTTLTIGQNRGAARLWIQGKILSSNGWTPGVRWTLTESDNGLVFTKETEGKRKVAGNDVRPVIDSKDPLVGATFEVGTKVDVTVDDSKIVVTEAE